MDLSGKLSLHSTDLSQLLDQMTDFEMRLQRVTSTPSNEGSELSNLSRDFGQFKTLVWQALSKIKAQTELLSLGLDRHETFLRRKTLLVHGVAETKDEKLYEVITQIITNKMQVELTTNDLQTCQRFGPAAATRKKPRAILVRFRDLDTRRVVWDSKTSLKSSGITISEFLTKTRHKVCLEARKHFGIRSCWSADGRIVILLPDKTRRRIEGEIELLDLVRLFPVARAANEQPLESSSSQPEAPKTKGKAAPGKQGKQTAAVPVAGPSRVRRQKL